METQVACTIVANNYLAYARVLARSFQARHPGVRFFVLFADRPCPEIDYRAEPFESIFAEDLGIPGFAHMALRYSLLELNTAVKPWFLRHLHRAYGVEAALYFDPDILVLGDLAPLYDRLGSGSDLLLTPHVLEPIEDRATPGERDLLLAGIYNLGFLGISFNQRTLELLDWWHRRLARECLVAVERGLFVDQRWMDFAPAFVARAEVLRDRGCNVAYWNLMHRRLERRQGSWRVDGEPLLFFHFSGLVWSRPELISRYQNRLTFAERRDLVPLFREYRAALAAAGHDELQCIPYAFDRFTGGPAVPPVARRLLQRMDPEGMRWPDPFEMGADTYLGWLLAPDDPRREPTLTRAAVAIWSERADLQEAFRSLDGAGRYAYAEWLLGRADHGLDECFLAPTAAWRDLFNVRGAHQDEAQRRVWDELARGQFGLRPLDDDEIATLIAEAAPPLTGKVCVRMPRLALMLHRMRRDVSSGFPDPAGRDRLGLAVWYATCGRSEYDLSWRLVAPVLRTLPLRSLVWALRWNARQMFGRRRRAMRPPAAESPSPPLATATPVASSAAVRPPRRRGRPKPGVNVIGWACAATGVGEACRGTLRALGEAGIPHALWSLGAHAFEDFSTGAAGGTGGQGAPFDVNLLHVNADMIETVTAKLPRWASAGRLRIGYWFWELSHFPLFFAAAFRHVDEVWAPSRFCLDAYTPLATVPVRWVPPAVTETTAEPRDRAALGVPASSFALLFAFDALSVPERKNPHAALRAFSRAHRDSPVPLHLLLKVNHAEAAPQLMAELQRQARGLPVGFVTGTLDRSATDALTATCDAYVSLHRSEGLGLPLIEAMYLGRPVIATGYGGCADFVDDSTAWVVRHRLVPLETAQGPYPAGAVWAEPDVEHAAELMLTAATALDARREKTEAARSRVTDLYSPGVAAARLRRELERVWSSMSGQSRPRRMATPAIGRLAQRRCDSDDR